MPPTRGGFPPEDLERPEAYEPRARGPVERVETHISWVFLHDDEVFKVKKPVDFGFLDFRTLAKRRAACEAEVELNARLAPDVYRGVASVRTDETGRARIGGEGPIVDWAVRMRRLPVDRRADHLLEHGALTPEMIDALAVELAAFHQRARADAATALFGAPRLVLDNVEENFAQADELARDYLRSDEAEEVVRWQTAFVRRNEALFEERMRAGHVRDGHGDLRLEHVYFEPAGIRVLDCIEFNERFRFGDVCSDVAFLSMDLASHGRVDLAERFLARYARATNDFDLYALIDFYEGYRAYVRGKISALTARDPSNPIATRRRAVEDARRFFALSLAAERRALLLPAVVAVGGLIASGKSTIAEAIGDDLGAPVVEADRTRKSMLGLEAMHPVHEQAWQGAYDPAFTERVYEEVLRRAAVVLASGRPVVLDASFRSPAMREAARALAGRYNVPFRFVECGASAATCRARLVERAKTTGVSDGRLEIFDAFAARFEPVAELLDAEHVVLDTGAPLEHSLGVLRERLDVWPPGFVR